MMREKALETTAIPSSLLEGVYSPNKMELSLGTRDENSWLRMKPLNMPSGVTLSVTLADGQVLRFES